MILFRMKYGGMWLTEEPEPALPVLLFEGVLVFPDTPGDALPLVLFEGVFVVPLTDTEPEKPCE
jgi:hypothetical protein